MKPRGSWWLQVAEAFPGPGAHKGARVFGTACLDLGDRFGRLFFREPEKHRVPRLPWPEAGLLIAAAATPGELLDGDAALIVGLMVCRAETFRAHGLAAPDDEANFSRFGFHGGHLARQLTRARSHAQAAVTRSLAAGGWPSGPIARPRA